MYTKDKSLIPSRIKDLGIFSGRPMFSAPLHVGFPNTPGRADFLPIVNEILDRNWLTNCGPVMLEFERQVANRLGIKHVVATCSGTMALELTILGLELTGEVIVPSFTFIATANALKMRGVQPVFCDIEPNSHCLAPKAVEKLITPKTSGVLGVHLWGRICNVGELEDICNRHGLFLFFDAAHAFGCTNGEIPVGHFGKAEVFSFHATKFFHTIEGGAVATNDDVLAEKIRRMRNFGFSGYDTVSCLGTNGKMTEISAAMGLANISHVDEMMKRLKEQHDLYASHLRNIDGVRMRLPERTHVNNCQYVVIEIDDSSDITRNDLIRVLRGENVLARSYFAPGCHRMDPYDQKDVKEDLPVTEAVADRVLCLPNNLGMSSKKIIDVCLLIRFAVERGKDISEKLSPVR